MHHQVLESYICVDMLLIPNSSLLLLLKPQNDIVTEDIHKIRIQTYPHTHYIVVVKMQDKQ